MTTNQLIKAIETKDFSDFEKVWTDLCNSLTETDKQNLLVKIIDDYYADKDLSFYVKLFDNITNSKVSLDVSLTTSHRHFFHR